MAAANSGSVGRGKRFILDLTPGTYILNGMGDLAMEHGIRKHIRTEVEVIKKTKSGLYYIRTSDGKFFSVPKFNLDTAEEVAERMARPPMTPEQCQAWAKQWRIEPTEDLKPTHGLDVEDEMTKRLISEITTSE